MSASYNSKLISKLYSAQKADDVETILKEMEEIKDETFLYPIFDTYNRYSATPMAHYFISVLNAFDSKDALVIAQKILTSGTIQKSNICWIFEVFEKFAFYEKYAVEIAVEIVNTFSNNKQKEYIFNDFNLGFILSYLQKGKLFNKVKNSMPKIFLDFNLSKDFRSMSLSYYLRNETSESFDFLIKNFDTFDEDFVILLTKEIVTWTGPKVQILIKLIKDSNCDRAIEIVSQAEKKAKKEAEQQDKQELQKYSNISLVKDIVVLRQQINQHSLANHNYRIFEDDETIMTQTNAVNSKEELERSCSHLRSIINQISENMSSHKLSREEIRTLLPSTEKSNYNKPLNRLFLFLSFHRYSITTDIHGLRVLNKILSLIGDHPEQEESFIKEMKKHNYWDTYTRGEYNKIHTKLLTDFKNSLEKILQTITKSKK